MQLSVDKIKNIIIAVLVLILIFLGYKYVNQIGKSKDDRLESEKLSKALADSIDVFKNKEGQWVYEKRTIQATMNELSKFNEQLTASQKGLLERVKKAEKNNTIISAALLDIGVKVNNLTNNKPVSIDSSSVTFAQKSDTISYNLTVSNIKPIEFKTPTLTFNSLELPNKQYVAFQWKNDKKEGYPVSFTVTNSNPLFKVTDINSYAIPELNKTDLKPTFWNKLGKFSTSTGGKLITFSIGLGAGYLLFK